MEEKTIEIIGKLAEVKTKYNLLIDYLINNSGLSYNNELRFDDIEKIIKTLEPEKYDARLDILKNEKDIEI